MKSRYLVSCAVAAMIGGSAHAQSTPSAETAAAADTAVGEIIVTATRRNESIQKVPLTIQAFTGATLAQLNVKNFNDLIKYTPNVTFGNNGPGAGAIFLRGLSTGFSGTQSAASISYFPNVSLYLDDQSMQFPGRNADIYVADLERVEVLEGPQGTLFGGGAQAGAVRYITNKPQLDAFSGHLEGSAGGTRHGAANGSFNATINVPVIENKLAVRAVIYNDHRGGYIDNVFGTFTRGSFDQYANYLPMPTAANQANAGQYNNITTAEKNYNPVDYIGGRISAKWQINEDWDILVSEMYQDLDSRNSFSQEPSSPDFTPLRKLQTVTFVPGYNKDEIWNTALTVNGKIGDLRLVYTGAYMERKLEAQQDYTNYSRAFGEYYQCVGSGTGIGSGTPFCYDPYSFWTDKTRNTHTTHEVRLSTPAEKRIRVIAGGFYEKFKIFDNMDFNYKSTPVCTAELIANGGRCLGLVQTGPGTTANEPGPRGPKTGFGQDLQRGYDQYAAFGSVDFDILPNLTLTAGTRYYHYKTYQTGSQFQTTAAACEAVLICNFTNPVTGGAFPGNVNIDAQNYKKTYNGFKSRVSVNYKPTNSMILFATFSEGFRPGGFNRSSALILPDVNGVAQFIRPSSYRPDNLTNYEVGIKTDLLDRRVQLNLSAYYMQWKAVQIQFFNPNGGFGNTAYVTNGADFDIKGFEAQLSARPFPGLSVNAGFTYNDSKQVSSPCLISNNPGSATLGDCITERYRAGVATPVQSPFGSKGSELPFAPKVQGNLRGRYDWEGQSNIGFWVAGGVTYTGRTFSQPSTYPSGDVPNPQNYLVTGDITKPTTTLLRYKMKGYALLDAQIGIKGENWTASIFGDNLTDSNVSTFTSSAQFIKSEVVVRPTTYGLRLSYDF